MTDSQLLAQAEAWRASAEDMRRKDRQMSQSVHPLTEAVSMTLEECASRLEKLVETYPYARPTTD